MTPYHFARRATVNVSYAFWYASSWNFSEHLYAVFNATTPVAMYLGQDRVSDDDEPVAPHQ